MESRNIKDEIGNIINDGITKVESIILHENEIESDVRDSLVLNKKTNGEERITRYGSNKADDSE